MSCYPEPDNNITNKFKVVLNLSIYSTKTELNDSIDVAKSDWDAKKIL